MLFFNHLKAAEASFSRRQLRPTKGARRCKNLSWQAKSTTQQGADARKSGAPLPDWTNPAGALRFLRVMDGLPVQAVCYALSAGSSVPLMRQATEKPRAKVARLTTRVPQPRPLMSVAMRIATGDAATRPRMAQ